MNSLFGKLNFLDLLKSVVLTIIAALTTTIVQILDGWTQNPATFPKLDTVSLIISVKVAVLAGISYLVKQLITNSQGAILAKEKKPGA